MFTNLVLILCCAGLIWLALKRRERPELTPVLLGVLVLVFAIIVGRMVFRSGSEPARMAHLPTFFEATGYQVGKAVAETVPGGGVVLVIHPDPRMSRQFESVLEAQVRGLRDGLGGGAFRLVRRTLQADESDDLMALGYHMDANGLLQHLQQVPESSAVVLMEIILVATEKGPWPPVFLTGSPEPEMVGGMLRQGLVEAAVVVRQGADWSTKPGSDMSLDDVFTLRYELLRRP